MKTLIILLISGISFLLNAQTYKVVKITGSVKSQKDTEEKWNDVKQGDLLNSDYVIVTDDKSSIVLSNEKNKFTLKEASAVNISRLKKLSIDELLLALAMENIISTPKPKKEGKSKSTAVYGTKVGGRNNLHIISDNFGVKKLNGAVQLAENGFKESAIVAAKETFRKYPETNTLIPYRIYFADILNDLGLYEEAYGEFSEIKKLELTPDEKSKVEERLNQIGKKFSMNK